MQYQIEPGRFSFETEGAGLESLSDLLGLYGGSEVMSGASAGLTVDSLTHGLDRIVDGLRTASLLKLTKLVDRIVEDVLGEEGGPSKQDLKDLAMFRQLLMTSRHLGEVALTERRDVRVLSIDPRFRKTQEVAELSKVIGMIKDAVEEGVFREDLSRYQREAARLCKRLGSLDITESCRPVILLDRVGDHCQALLGHELLREGETTLEELHEFRKNVRRALLFSRIAYLGAPTDDVIEVHRDLLGASRALGKARDRLVEEMGGTVADESSFDLGAKVTVGEEVRRGVTGALEGVLATIHNVRISAGQASSFAGIDHEQYFNLMALCARDLRGNDLWKVNNAYELAKAAHRGTWRMGGLERYFDHVRAVSAILLLEAEVFDPDVHAAALLHDVLEDTAVLGNGVIFGDTLSREIAREYLTLSFGPRVAEGVLGVTKFEKTGDPEKDRENKRRYLEGIDTGSDIVVLIKMADRLHNLRSLPPTNLKFTVKQLRETIVEYLPIFSRYVDRAGQGYEVAAERLFGLILETIGVELAKLPDDARTDLVRCYEL